MFTLGRNTHAEKIHRGINQPFAVHPTGQMHYSTPSIGVTLFRGQDLSVEVLLKQSDVALYQAKAAGRNTIRFFNPEMHKVDPRVKTEMH